MMSTPAQAHGDVLSAGTPTMSWGDAGWLLAIGICALAVPVASTGPWVVCAPAAVVLCYLAGRKLGSAPTAVATLVLATVLGGVILLLTERPSLLGFFLTLLTASVLLVLLPWFLGCFRRAQVLYRAQEQEHLMIQAGLRERSRIAAQMHDQLGHDLALLALQASALQVGTEPGSPTAAQAEKLRDQADRAIENLHRILTVLREPGGAAPLDPTHDSPTPVDYRHVISQAQGRGLQVKVLGAPPDSLTPGTRGAHLLHKLVREALTNAAKYAPGQPVSVSFLSETGKLAVEISNPSPDPSPAPRPEASGLASLTQLFESQGGTLSFGNHHQLFTLRATLPEKAVRHPLPTLPRPVLTRPRRWLAIAVPAAIAMVLCLGLYCLQLATYRATGLAPADYQRLELGMDRTQVDQLVTANGLDQALPIINESQAPAGSSCRYYAARTDPLDLNSEMFRLCFSDNLLVSMDHLYPGGSNS
ncbi:sensor histidine kinase [Glutamicibacter sp. NPDC087344]|uniref:sensor histidine kinase n=1 Tax=Glutamicibacter sp. NPDC087344 TaxID=3363994 RepID=UPI00382EA34F